MPSLTPVVKWLLISNVAIFLIDIFMEHALTNWGAFAIQSALMEGRVWEFITFQFLHGSVGHILFNSMGLYFFGPWMERWWGSRRFLVFYLLCGIGGAAFYTLLTVANILPSDYGIVGASAGIYGILIGVAVIAPQLRVALMFVIEMTMRQLAILILIVAVGTIIFGLKNPGGEAGHLGGALVGFLLMKFPKLLSWARRRNPEVDIIRPKQFSRRRSEPKIKPRTSVDLRSSTEVDAILDKISREGYQSLTEEEREILKRASQSHTHKP
jgi:membrane associated rhomboid family serine protease